MDTEKHNGWTNYATWRIYCELFDYNTPHSIREYFVERIQNKKGYTTNDLIHEVKDKAIDTVIEECIGGKCPDPNHLAVSYAIAFMTDVNWNEIASHVNEKD